MAAHAHIYHIRSLNPDAVGEVEWVAARMRQTLEEVLGAERGRAMYTMDWLIARVRWHLDPEQATAEVFLAEDQAKELLGHTIVRVERDEAGEAFGLFSTTFVVPAARRSGVATRLLLAGEAWMRAHQLPEAATFTGDHNTKLIQLYQRHGYTLSAVPPEMVRLSKRFG
jgi:GNAT superfamily N-acetyltransferase